MILTKTYLAKLSVLAKKSFGQHFLISENIIKKIIEESPHDPEGIIEIGPGPGVLTRHLNSLSKNFWAVEKDDDFQEILHELLPEKHLFIEDALNFRWEKIFNETNLSLKNFWLVSNLPYNISVPLTMKFFQIQELSKLTLMYQKEVGDKFLPKISKKHNWMNSLFVLANTYFHVKKITSVKPTSFLPAPKVDSLVLSFTRREETLLPHEQLHQLEKFCKIIFQNRRKQLKVNLKNYAPDLHFYYHFLETESLPLTLRAEELKLEQVLKLFHLYSENLKWP